MSHNEMSAVISATDLQAVRQAIATLREKLPLRAAASADTRRRLTKLGPKSMAFVTTALGAAQAHPELVPAAVNVPGLATHLRLFESLGSIASELVALAQAVMDARTVAGGEAMGRALTVYGALEAVARIVPEAGALRHAMSARFRKRARGAPEGPAQATRLPRSDGGAGAAAALHSARAPGLHGGAIEAEDEGAAGDEGRGRGAGARVGDDGHAVDQVHRAAVARPGGRAAEGVGVARQHDVGARGAGGAAVGPEERRALLQERAVRAGGAAAGALQPEKPAAERLRRLEHRERRARRAQVEQARRAAALGAVQEERPALGERADRRAAQLRLGERRVRLVLGRVEVGRGRVAGADRAGRRGERERRRELGRSALVLPPGGAGGATATPAARVRPVPSLYFACTSRVVTESRSARATNSRSASARSPATSS